MTWLDFELSKKKILEFIDTVNKLRHKSRYKKKKLILDFLNNLISSKTFDQFNFEIQPPNQKKNFLSGKSHTKKKLSQKKKINS